MARLNRTVSTNEFKQLSEEEKREIRSRLAKQHFDVNEGNYSDNEYMSDVSSENLSTISEDLQNELNRRIDAMSENEPNNVINNNINSESNLTNQNNVQQPASDNPPGNDQH